MRETAVLETLSAIEVPFLKALQVEYGQDRRWTICGPASIALSRLLSTATRVPIQQAGTGEHIELEMRIYDPKDASDRRIDHTYIRYSAGETEYYIDPIYQLLWKNKQMGKGAIRVEAYPKGQMDQALSDRYSLYPFPNNPNSEVWQSIELYTKPSNMQEVHDVVAALNDNRALMNSSFNDFGVERPSPWWGDRVLRVIQAVDPSVKQRLSL